MSVDSDCIISDDYNKIYRYPHSSTEAKKMLLLCLSEKKKQPRAADFYILFFGHFIMSL
jgi:hypothetical protein